MKISDMSIEEFMAMSMEEFPNNLINQFQQLIKKDMELEKRVCNLEAQINRINR